VKWLVTGSDGMLGTDLVEVLRSSGEDVTATTLTTLDITDDGAVETTVEGHDVVVNTAAWTAVDDAEKNEPAAAAVNAEAPRLLARAARQHGARLVQVSTDYVFDGSARTPYAEDAPTAPTSAYGRTKASGEQAVREELPDGHLLVRTAWLYGAHGGCFPKTIARVARERGGVDVVNDQEGQPTWTRDVADLIVRLVHADAPSGTYHATSSGQCTWYDFAQMVVVAAGLESSTVQPTTSESVEGAARRPAYSVLGHEALHRIGLTPIDEWEQRWAVAAPAVLAHDQSHERPTAAS
jgi:dTDP-4-dehydrorhamnose reductase